MSKTLLFEAQLRFDGVYYGISREELAKRYGVTLGAVARIVESESFDGYLQVALATASLFEAIAADDDLTSLVFDYQLAEAVDRVGRGLIATACALKEHSVAQRLLAIVGNPEYESSLSHSAYAINGGGAR